MHILNAFAFAICFFSYGNCIRYKNYRRAPAIPFTNGCPDNCACENSGCVIEQDNAIECSITDVKCYGRDIYELARTIPKNASSIEIGGDNSATTSMVLDLGIFKRFPKLTLLLIRDGTYRHLAITKKLRRVKKLRILSNQIETLPLKNLTRLPRLTLLDLTNNHIASISGVRFPKGITELKIDGNFITSLMPKSFLGKLLNLTTVSISGNQISTIEPSAFANVKLSLEVLDLSSNRLRRLEEDQFTNLLSVWYLDLRNNEIDSIDPTAFRYLGKEIDISRQIRMDNNRMQYINKRDLNRLLFRQKYYTMYFGGNPIYCDCAMMNLRDEGKDFFGDLNSMICASPREVVGTSVKELFFATCCGDNSYDYIYEEDYYDDDDDEYKK